MSEGMAISLHRLFLPRVCNSVIRLSALRGREGTYGREMYPALREAEEGQKFLQLLLLKWFYFKIINLPLWNFLAAVLGPDRLQRGHWQKSKSRRREFWSLRLPVTVQQWLWFPARCPFPLPRPFSCSPCKSWLHLPAPSGLEEVTATHCCIYQCLSASHCFPYLGLLLSQ